MLQNLFGATNAFIGVVHLHPLPGSPRWQGDMNQVKAWAQRDARTLADGGAHGLIVENYGDAPFEPGRVEAHTVAGMTLAAQAVKQVVDLPVGINVLRNDPKSAMAVALATGAQFVRINVHYGVMAADEGIMQGEAHETLRYRRAMGLENQVKIFADVLVKHAVPLGTSDLEYLARETVERGLADVLIVSGSATGEEASPRDVEQVKASVRQVPVLVGSGIDEFNVGTFLSVADGAIVGTSLKVDGKIENPIDQDRVVRLATKFVEVG